MRRSIFQAAPNQWTSVALNMVAQHQCCLLWSARRLHQSRSVATMVVAKGLKMTKVGKGMRPSSGPSEDLRDALKAFEAKTDSHADRLAQIEGHGRVVSATVDLLSASVDSRFAVLAAELNQYAVQIEQGKAAVEASLQTHLARIDSTFQQCDATLGTTQELMSSSPAAAPPATVVPLVFTQDLLAIRRNIDESEKRLQR